MWREPPLRTHSSTVVSCTALWAEEREGGASVCWDGGSRKTGVSIAHPEQSDENAVQM